MPRTHTYEIGLIFATSYQYAREMIEGISKLGHQKPEVRLHILSESGHIPEPDQLRTPLNGVIAFNTSKDLERLRRLTPNVVCTSSRIEPTGGDFVVNDDVETGRVAAKHFIHRGYRDLVFIGHYGLHYSNKRREGFVEQARSSNVDAVCLELNYGDELKLIPEKLLKLPSRCGVFAANDHIARSLMNSIDQAVTKVPLHHAILGVDNDLLQRVLCPVPLSSVELDGRGIGYAALKRCLQRIDNPGLPFETQFIPPLKVKTRQSTDLFALEDDLAAKALEVMDDHLPDIHHVGDLVDRMNVPRRTLELRFRNATGRTLARELAVLRVERARDLLRNSEMDTDAIAREVGLPESRMLWLLFKRLTGETPSAYRKRMPSLD